MINYETVLSTNYVGKEWSLVGNDYSTLVWHSAGEPPTQAELEEQWSSVQQKIADEATAKAAARQALLTRLGITAEEAQLLLGGI